MNFALNRRSFLKRSILTAGALSAVRLLPVPNILAAAGPGRSSTASRSAAADAAWVATSTGWSPKARTSWWPLWTRTRKRLAQVKKWLKEKGRDSAQLQTFTDYRVMFDKIGKQIDAVCIAAPNHQHALPAMIAMQLGKGVLLRKAAHP